MRTIFEHLDDLDRMVDGGADKAAIRSQIAFIGREVAALEAENAQLVEANTKLQEAHLQFQAAKNDPSADSPRFSGSGGTTEHLGS